MTETIEALRRDLQEARERLLAVVAGVTEEQFKRRPAPDSTSAEAETPWCIAEVLAHLLASERLQAERIERALEQDGALIEPPAPGSQEAAARAGRAAPVPQLIHGLLAVHRQIEQLLSRADALPDGLTHHVVHPLSGAQSVAWLMRERVIDHEREHTAQIEAIKTALGAGRPTT